MLSTAMRILKHTPALRQVNIRWAREQCPNHLKQEGSYDVVLGKDARPESVAVVERGIPLFGRPFCRRFKVGIDFGRYEAEEERREWKGKGKRASWVGGASFGGGFRSKGFGGDRSVDLADASPAVEAMSVGLLMRYRVRIRYLDLLIPLRLLDLLLSLREQCNPQRFPRLPTTITTNTTTIATDKTSISR
jgi:hypothetical protein